MSDYHVSVIGGGSVGLCLAASFAKAGAGVSLLVRRYAVDSLSAQSIEVTGLLGEHTLAAGAIKICDATAPDADILASDMLIVTTKAHDVSDALTPFCKATPCPPLLLLQNGIGASELAKELLGPDVPVYSTAMMIGMVRHAANKVEVTAQASPIYCGAMLGDDPTALTKCLRVAEQGFVPMQLDQNIRETISFKVLFNSCMNPTGALTDQTYGKLLINDHSRKLIVGLADETLNAFEKAYDYRPSENGEDYVENTLKSIVFPRSQGHKSSMLQDMEAGRKTEIDFLNGAISKLAAEHGLSAVRHDVICRLIKAKESSFKVG